MKSLSLDIIRTDGGTQPREQVDTAVVAEYAATIADLPPVVVFFDGKAYWLADGFHRYEAHKSASADVIDADVRQGTQRDAILYSVGANADHGIRRTNADKRRAVTRLLSDEEWGRWSDRKVADKCAVSDRFVGTVRAELTPNGSGSERVYTTRHGTTATMNIANMGKPAPSVTFGTITDNEPPADETPAARELREAREARRAANAEKAEESREYVDSAPFAAMEEHDEAAAEMKSLGPTPREEADAEPGRRWAAAVHKLYVFMNSTRDAGGIRQLASAWPKSSRKEHADELRRIAGEIQKWIQTLEGK
jgi:uncharacterized ParB-like nuclease family protein